MSLLTTAVLGALAGLVSSEPTWSDVRPIVEKRCAPCHYSEGPAGFALLEPKHFRPRRRQVERAVRSGEMPPWLPHGTEPRFVGDRRLSASEKELLLDWLAAGTPGIDEPVEAATTPSSDWQLGPPDLVVSTETLEIPASGDDIFRNLVAPVTPLTRPVWVQAVELRPSSSEAVHHVVLAVDETASSRQLDAADPKPGFSGMATASKARSPGGSFVGWTPGKSAHPGSTDVAWLLQPGADFVALLHLLPSGSPRSVALDIGLHFAAGPPSRQPVPLRLGSMSLEIAAGAKPAVVRDRFVLPATVTLESVYPHAHYLARRLEAWAELPDGRKLPLLEIPAWDFHWQDQYRLESPLLLPKGTELAMRYTYEAAAPERTVYFGPSSFDEMADLWLELFAADPEDQRVLEQAAERHQLRNAEAGLRHEISREASSSPPSDLRFRLASNLLAQGRSPEAVTELETALAIDGEHVGALTNLGNLMLGRGERARAVELLARASELSPSSSDAHFNLGNALMATGADQGALESYRETLKLAPENDGAWLNRGIVLYRMGDTQEAVESFRRAAELEPSNVAAWINLAWLSLETGESSAAQKAFERASELLPGDPRLEALAQAIEAAKPGS